MEVPVPIDTVSSKVGFGSRPQTMPLSIIGDLPSLTIVPVISTLAVPKPP